MYVHITNTKNAYTWTTKNKENIQHINLVIVGPIKYKRHLFLKIFLNQWTTWKQYKF